MKLKAEIKCPVCKGKGKLATPKAKFDERKYEMARVLVHAGYSFREVADLLGYKSPQSISKALKAETK